MKKSLTGLWKLTDGQGIELDAQVPGCVYLDLLREHLIPDPYYGTNEKKCYWVSLRDWQYSKKFTLTSSDFAHGDIRLIADMLDTICDIYLNGERVGQGNNCHIQYVFSVRQLLREGENEISVRFRSPVLYVREKQAQDPCPINWNGQRGINHIRKPQYHFGWDWGPELPPVGITKDIFLESFDGPRIDGLHIRQEHGADGVKLRIGVQTENCGGGICELTVLHPDGKRDVLRRDAEKSLVFEHVIREPQLWYTWDLSDRAEQPLYTIEARIYRGEALAAQESRKIGLRQIRLRREKDEYGSNFQFEINGIPLFIKGANVIPSETFITREFEQRVQRDVEACRFSNCNMLRMWGGGYYSSEFLLDLCDRYGILVWQDFAFACQPYPFYNEAFLENVREEVRQTVCRMRHHACLAVWCGNNETEAGANHWIHIDRFREATEFFFWNELPRMLKELDADTPYTPGSPIGDAFMQGWDSDDYGDNHLWQVWHGLQPLSYYRTRQTRFCSEFGFESLPAPSVLHTFVPDKKLSLRSRALAAHQKCKGGNLRMEYYVLMHRPRPKTFAGFAYLTQVCQTECVRDATEFWRRNKHRCHGSIYWQLNDCWPVCSWSSKDYFNNYKALQYVSRRFFAPIIVTVEEKEDAVDVIVVNDTRDPLDAQVEYFVFDFESGEVPGTRQCRELTVEALANCRAVTLSRKQMAENADLARIGMHVCLRANGKEISACNWFFLPEKELHFPKNQFRIRAERENGRIKIAVQSDTFARYVQLQNAGTDRPFSDNFFDLMPGETKIVYQDAEGDREPAVTAISCGNIPIRKSRFFAAMRLKRVRKLLKKYPI